VVSFSPSYSDISISESEPSVEIFETLLVTEFFTGTIAVFGQDISGLFFQDISVEFLPIFDKEDGSGVF
jgi:hypothetical protein